MSKKSTNNWIWWKHGVIYHIYPRSFYDSNEDGIGDIKGITKKLDYLQYLGIDAIWLSPVYQSPKIDFGYDVSNYKAIDPDYGNLNDFVELLEESHKKGIKVIMDMIMNHTSDQHPWFIESASSEDNPKRNWYIWQKGKNGKKPNNWKSSFGKSAWEYNSKTKAYYLHSFFKEQPDLNWRDEEMSKAFFEEIKFWLEMGVDGFRLDVINMIVKDKKYRNNPFQINIPFLQEQKFSRNRPKSHYIVKKLRKLTDNYEDRVLIGEVYVMPPGDSELSASYLSNEEKALNMAFDFSLIFRKWNANVYYKCIYKSIKSIPKNGWPCNVLSNHDLSRSINRYPFKSNPYEKAKIEAILLLTLKGTPFIYYGEEIGMKNTYIPYHKLKDPLGKRYWPFYNGRDKARTPMQWDEKRYSGFSKTKPWLPVSKNYKKVNVNLQKEDNHSLLYLYRRLIQLRKENICLQAGDFIPVKKGKKGVLAYIRGYENEKILIILNFSSRIKEVHLYKIKEKELLFSTHPQNNKDISEESLRLSAFEARIYKVIH